VAAGFCLRVGFIFPKSRRNLKVAATTRDGLSDPANVIGQM
jgi:hypothetical protein